MIGLLRSMTLDLRILGDVPPGWYSECTYVFYEFSYFTNLYTNFLFGMYIRIAPPRWNSLTSLVHRSNQSNSTNQRILQISYRYSTYLSTLYFKVVLWEVGKYRTKF